MSNRTRQVTALAARIAGAALQVGVVLLVGRLLGAAVLGRYLVFQAGVRLAGTVVGWGHPWYVLRTVAEQDELGHPAEAERAFRTSLAAQFRLLGAFALVAVPVVAWSTWSGGGPIPAVLGWAGIAGVAGFAVTAIGSFALKARQRQPMALFLEFSATPLAVAAAAVGANGASGPAPLTWLAVAHGASAVAAALIGLVMFERTPAPAPGEADGADAANLADAGSPADLAAVAATAPANALVIDGRDAARSRLAFGSTNVVNMIGQNVPQLLLALVLPIAEVGKLGAVLRLTAIPGTFAVGLTSVYGPRFAKLWVARDRRTLRATLRETQVWMTGLYLPFAVAFVAVPELVSDQLGADFHGAATALRLLGIGQLVNALTGQAPMMLSMCRDEVQAFARMAIGVAVALALSVGAGAAWGVNGAAAGLAAGLAVQNLAMWVRAHELVTAPRRLAT